MKSVVLCLAVVLGVACAVPARREHCPEICPLIYHPICGSDGVETMTFDNECRMKQYGCLKSRTFTMLKVGGCVETDPVFNIEHRTFGTVPVFHICPAIWAPVCGSNGVETKTFPNQCTMEAQNRLSKKAFRAVRSGTCEEEVATEVAISDCPPCPYIWAPVCASNGEELRTFGSECDVESYNCLNRAHFTKTRSGEC